jgi:outer membrane cobalamin receptor
MLPMPLFMMMLLPVSAPAPPPRGPPGLEQASHIIPHVASASASSAGSSVEPGRPTETIVVRAERLGNSGAGQGIDQLDSDDLASLSHLRLDEALRTIPGAGLFRRTASGAANATIQGLGLRPIAPNGAGRALVSLDGVPQNDPFGGWIYWARYDPLFLSRVDVRKGGEGAGFGPQALSGTLDLFEARDAMTQTRAYVASHNQIAASARTGLTASQGTLVLMGAYERSDGTIPVALEQRGPVDEKVDFQAGSGAATLRLDQGDAGLWSFRLAAFSEDKGAGLQGAQSAARGADASAAYRISRPWGEARALFYAQARDFSNQTSSVSLNRSVVTPALDQVSTPSTAVGGSMEMAPGWAGRGDIRLVLDGRRAQGRTEELFRFIGDQFTRTRTAGGLQDLAGIGLTFDNREIGRISSNIPLVVSGTIRLDHWANRDGLRLEQDRQSQATTLFELAPDQSGTVLNGRLGMALFKDRLGVTIYRTFRPPTLNELHRPFRVGNDVTEANALLRPEVLDGVEVSGRWQGQAGNSAWAVSMVGYLNRLRDPITNVTIATGPGILPRVGFLPAGGTLRERQNAGRIDASGVETSIIWTPGSLGTSVHRPAVRLAANYTDARVDGGSVLPALTGKRPAQAPVWSGYASIDLPLDIGLATPMVFQASVRAEGDRFEDDLNSRRLKSYSVVDTRISWQIHNGFEVFLAAENLGDQRVETGRAGDGTLSIAQGRSLRIGFQTGTRTGAR